MQDPIPESVDDIFDVLWATHRASSRGLGRTFLETGLTQLEHVTLLLIESHYGVETAQLALWLRREPSAIARVVRGLWRRRLITTFRDNQDKRHQRLALTAIGRAMNRLGDEHGLHACRAIAAACASEESTAENVQLI